MSSSDDCEMDEVLSQDSLSVESIIEWQVEDSQLLYLCKTSDGGTELVDRSDLMDGAALQMMVLRHERQHPPPWDAECTFCNGEGCEECICDECERPCRHINGINYGCEKHPVV